MLQSNHTSYSFTMVYTQSRNQGAQGEAPLQNFKTPWKNVLSTGQNYWT